MKMKKIFIIAVLILISNCYMMVVYAAKHAPLATIIDAIGNKGCTDGCCVGDWEKRIEKIKGVKWKWSVYEMGAHDVPMEGITVIGRDKNPNIGKTEILVEGPQSGPEKISISIANKENQVEILDLFGTGKLKRIATSCDINEASAVDLTYKYTKNKYDPLYINYTKSWGKTGSIDIIVSCTGIEAVLQGDCKVLNP